MKQAIYTKIITICLLLLAILPVFSAFNLTWKELVRLFIITLGLLYLYIRYFRRTKPQPQGVEGTGNLEPRTLNLEPTKPRTLNLEPLLLSIVYIFLITQFDPATSAIKDIIPQSRLNWFFIASSVLIAMASGALLLQWVSVRNVGAKVDREKKYSFLDRLMLIGGGTLILAIFIVKVSSGIISFGDLPGTVKIVAYIVIYFLITRIYRSDSVGKAVEEKGKVVAKKLSIAGIKERFQRLDIQLVALVLTTIFCLICFIGGYRIITAVWQYKRLNIYKATERWDRAIEACRQVVKLDPGSAKHHVTLGRLYDQGGMWEEAKTEYLRGLSLSKDVIAEIAIPEEVDKRVDLYNGMIGLDPNNWKLYYKLGKLYLHRGETNKAIGAFREVIRIRPKYLWGYVRLGQAYASADSTDVAIAELREMASEDPDNEVIWTGLARVDWLLGRMIDEAIAAAQKAVEINPDYQPAWNVLKQLHKEGKGR